MEPNDFEYFEGTRTIAHEDGSHTYITTYHEPYIEPLTGKQQAAVLGVTVAAVAAVVALPAIVVGVGEWLDDRREIRRAKKAKKIADLKNQSQID